MAGTSYQNRSRIFDSDHSIDLYPTEEIDTRMVSPDTKIFDQIFFCDPSRSGAMPSIEAVLRHIQENLIAAFPILG
jgi:hypothetical protein